MSLFEKVYETFLENTVETVAEQVKEKTIAILPFAFAGVFVLTSVLVIFRRLGR
tara:strand:- start:418 stop:579 length:162 start_codon:yes stop_codon:yes gene_type:complete